jgi:SAM-dependent methyltransferase
MEISFFKKLRILLMALSTIHRRPRACFFIDFVKPIDGPRYVEFAYLINFLEKYQLKNLHVLDVSSPHTIDYLLAKNNYITKVNYDEREKRYIRPDDRLVFKREDATKLSFADNSFDFTISISVIEHIYKQYADAVREMVRVTKSGGYVYLTFPVAKQHVEEWVTDNVYVNQYNQSGNYFFQYRFSQDDMIEIIRSATNCDVVESDIFWEKKDGYYDRMIGKLKNKDMNRAVRLIRIPFIHLWYGFNLFKKESGDFPQATSCGNMHVVLKKR